VNGIGFPVVFFLLSGEEGASSPIGAREANGIASSFEAFFDAEHRKLFGTLCVLTGDPGEAEDIMQEAFVRVWERWGRVASHPDPAGYLFRTAFSIQHNRYRRALRAARRAVVTTPARDSFALVDEVAALATALRTLTLRQRSAIVLTELLGYSSEEAGRLMGIRSSTVRVLASNARHALRSNLGVADE
jgi:RNA polymerase sigma-70 factor (ECF subfamily)